MKKTATGGHPDLKMVNPAAAAIDIGSTMHMAAVNPDASDMPVRACGTFTQDLHDLADWFDACGVTSVAMESTGVYWIPAFEVLETRGFHVILVNARYAKNVPGRKTDVSDAGWLRQLHSYGLLRGSFRPAAEIAELSLKVGDGEIGWHIKALLTRRSSRREKDMLHDEGYGCRVSRARWIFTRSADRFAATRCAAADRTGGRGRAEWISRHSC